jgi:hypothetical protein
MKSEKLWLVLMASCVVAGITWGFDVEQGRWIQQGTLIVAGIYIGLILNNIFNGSDE